MPGSHRTTSEGGGHKIAHAYISLQLPDGTNVTLQQRGQQNFYLQVKMFLFLKETRRKEGTYA